jgi:hypothetical protein
LAGIAGVDPNPLTLRELIAMAEAKSRDNWNHTSSILALIINVNRNPKKQRAVKPNELNPHEQKVRAILRGKDLRILKDVFVDRENAKESNLNDELQKTEKGRDNRPS